MATEADPGSSPDLLLVNAAVLTMSSDRRRAEAVAIARGRISGVGTTAELDRMRGPRTRRVDLGGRTVLPSFQDAHCHPSMAGIGLLRCPLHELPQRLDVYLGAIAAYAAANPGHAWVLGDGWYMEAFPGGTPSRHDLDRVVPDRPAFFVNRDGHGAWVNTKALEVLGFDRHTPDPPHGRIEREPDGTPSGTLHEGAMELAKSFLPPTTAADMVAGLRLAQAYLNRLGITAWQDAWVTPFELDAYRELAAAGQLTARVTACHWWEREQGLEQVDSIAERRRATGPRGRLGRLRADTVKIMLDGVAENFTAAMLAPYLDAHGRPTGNSGIDFVAPPLLDEAVTRLDALGFQVHFHALGDRAVRQGLDAVARAQATNGRSDHRHHLAHLQVVDPADIPRFAELGAVATIQPLWATHEPQMDDLTVPFLGAERTGLQYPFGDLRRAGARIAGGSDWTVSTPNVPMQVEAAVNRVAPAQRGGEPFLPEQALDVLDALAAFTSGTAYVNHLDDETGSLELGKRADLAILDRDVLDRAAGPIGDATIIATLLDGEPVFETDAFRALG
ncbi:MAG TPA: amidohydrolase [Candidatus Limnocylindrales bacterium]|nr:amidohydrolase [Candidatus Limnocylindrales bacterium]